MDENYDERRKDGNIEDFAIEMKKRLYTDVTSAATDVFQNVDVVSGTIQQNITAVQQLCNGLADALDKELHGGAQGTVKRVKDEALQKGGLVSGIKNCICDCGNCKNQDCGKKAAAELIMCALTSTVRQVGNELYSVFLYGDRIHKDSGRSIAAILDHITPIAKKLDGELQAATKTPPGQPFPTTPDAGTAQAVDKKLEAVRDEVIGLVGKFNSQVKQPLALEVEKLGPAVDQFNSNAETQIRAAARTAITAAAEQISNSADVSDSDMKKLMTNFSGQFSKITDQNDGLQPQLQGLLNDHIGQDDPPSPSGGIAEKVKITDKSFPLYNGHVKQENPNLKKGQLEGIQGEGQLPLAIGNIKTVGLAALSIIEKNGGSNQIDKDTFIGPFTEITKQLGEIRKLVAADGILGKGDRGVKNLLAELQNGLQLGTLDGAAEKGLEQITKAISLLQTGNFRSGPEAIDTAVKAIKAQLGKLREKLQNPKGQKEDVILTLKDLQNEGLGKGAWNGKTVSGLGKIQDELKGQLAILAKQPGEITAAIKTIVMEIGTLGYRLNNIFNTTDLVDTLRSLQRKIGKTGRYKYKDNLLKIYDVIKDLHDNPLKTHPQTIDGAKQQIADELTALQGELQGSKPGKDVIKSLEDLQSNGLTEKDWKPNNSNNNKGLAKINSELQGQQKTLTTQPGAIGGGVDQITKELDDLRQQLNTEVTVKLQKLREHGLEKGDTEWSEGNNINGLVKIRN
ncbi:Extracellular matrix-binding ebh, putative [Babesia ovata]|uniref:Extracellular matrix-binding ebh, putative n=1 Tax=Babesia ovata TaxID=189622 RepID=A0A2H6K7U5_9APIC|nr:Extracellular matrix-binding ebh, putative [Babesia ovata]GBE59048.1 Extracellular matrix-binding ebh, putative [Babesia ovata]